jgi:chromosome segregation ATPase
MGITLWFMGLNMIGGGVSTAFIPGDDSFLTNLGFSLALCLAPGGFLALLGAIFYGYDYRRGRKAQVVSQSQAAVPTARARERADKLRRATDYRTHVATLLKQYRNTSLANQLVPMVKKLNQWENHLRQLVNRLNEFEMNQVVQRDIREAPAAIARLQAQLKSETNPQVRAQMAETLAGYQEHQRQLDSLVMVMRRTELEIDETLAEIGAIYSRLQLLDAKEIDRNRAKRLSADIEEQAGRLGDLLSAMDEVYESSAGVG